MIPLLKGVRVLELTSVVMGPFAGQILSDLGADVIKVEPLSGDIARQAQPMAEKDMGAMYINNNRNKRAIALDLKSGEGQAIIERLVGWSEVFLHNMRMDAMKRLRLDFERAAQINPQLIYCSAIGFGQGGRYRNRPAFDDVIQAACGLAGLTHQFGEEPRFIPTIIADKVGALHAVYGILAALVSQSRGHIGAVNVEAPMFEALVSFLLNEHLAGATFAQDGEVGYSRIFDINRRPHRTKDGWIAVLPYTAAQWERFFAAIGREDVIRQPWFSNAAERSSRIEFLYREVSKALPEHSTGEWMELLLKLDIPCSEVNTLEDLLKDPHLLDVDFFHPCGNFPREIARTLPQPVNFEGIGRSDDRMAPRLGHDTRDILRMCGFNDAEVGQFLQKGVAKENIEPAAAKA
jgi:crotonobetainyl-CoA:carnitine CoA-transferase CaiB-like acyl-CoA transferase